MLSENILTLKYSQFTVCSCIPRPKAGSGDEATNVLYMYVHEGVTVVPSLSALL